MLDDFKQDFKTLFLGMFTTLQDIRSKNLSKFYLNTLELNSLYYCFNFGYEFRVL